jgi:hypothetical protein
VWFNSLIDGKKEKWSVEGIQLNIKIDGYLRNKFKKKDYMILWELKDEQNNLLGMSNGVYVLPLGDKIAPNKVVITISKLDSDRMLKNISKFILIQKASE